MTDPRSRSNIHVGVKRNPPDLNPDSLHHDGSFGKYMQASAQKELLLSMTWPSLLTAAVYQRRSRTGSCTSSSRSSLRAAAACLRA
jgi:hypothetical protein